MSKKSLFIFALSFFLVSPFVFQVNAQEQEDEIEIENESEMEEESTKPSKPPRLKEANERVKEAREKQLEIKENIKSRASDAAQKRQEKLSENRKKVCENRAKSIKNRLNILQTKAKTIHTGHGKIFERVDKFYNEKLVPNGYELDNYDDLKAEIETNKETVKTLHEAAKENGADFDCESDDPKGQLEVFKEDMEELREANGEYKESIKIFVKAVLELAKTAKLEKLSASPSPEAEIEE